jgi:hypothetical protein
VNPCELKRVIKPYGAIILFGQVPFSNKLRVSNIMDYKYDWVWGKTKAMKFHQGNNSLLCKHESILTFSGGEVGHAVQTKKRMPYDPQGTASCNKFKQCKAYADPHGYLRLNGEVKSYSQTQENYLISVLRYNSAHNPPHRTPRKSLWG